MIVMTTTQVYLAMMPIVMVLQRQMIVMTTMQILQHQEREVLRIVRLPLVRRFWIMVFLQVMVYIGWF